MHLTETEIFNQYEALQQTFDCICAQEVALINAFKETKCTSITFIGCGSSYSLAKSAALSARFHLGIPAYAVAGGDLYLNFEQYVPTLAGTLLVSISRSGSTTEVLRAIELAKARFSTPCFSISAVANSLIAEHCQYNIELPWCFDNSVCQTRCVTNFYCANLLFVALLAGNKDLVAQIQDTISNGPAYMEQYAPVMKEMANHEFSYITVLADAELEGIAEEGALAFNEISMLPSHYYHVLDVRHGPIVLTDQSTLVVAALSPADAVQQNNLLADFKEKQATIVTLSDDVVAPTASDCHVVTAKGKYMAPYGIPFIFICQTISYYKALLLGNNPDQPSDLKAWIEL